VLNNAWATVGNLASMCGMAESFHFHYSLGEMLGHGAQGIVHTCTHRHSGRGCAVKLISRRCKDAFRHEVDILKMCQSGGNLMQMHEYFTGGYYHYIVLDQYHCHLQGALKRFIKRGNGRTQGLCDVSLRNLLAQGLKAISHLHKNNIVHRDVKAENFLVDRQNLDDPSCQLVLGDFGLAQKLRKGYCLRARVGTDMYWSPEIYDGKYAHEVDVFAFGVVAFVSSVGAFPFANEKACRTQDPFEGRTASPRVQGFTQLCLEKVAAKRQTAAALSQHEWVAAAAHELPRLLAAHSDQAGMGKKEHQSSAFAFPSTMAEKQLARLGVSHDDASTVAGSPSPDNGDFVGSFPPMVSMLEVTIPNDTYNVTEQEQCAERPEIDMCARPTTVEMPRTYGDDCACADRCSLGLYKSFDLSLGVSEEALPKLVQRWMTAGPKSQTGDGEDAL